MPGRPRNPATEPGTLEERIITALRNFGGSSQRNALREAIRPQISTADFDRAIDALAGRGDITGEEVTLTWTSHYGKELPYRAIIYKLAPPGRRKRSTVPPPRARVGKKRSKPIPEGAELEDKILAVLRESGEPMSRTYLRMATDGRLSPADFDVGLSALLATERITVTNVMRQRTGRFGPISHQVTVYSVPKARKRAK
jgi:hypothetical protein